MGMVTLDELKSRGIRFSNISIYHKGNRVSSLINLHRFLTLASSLDIGWQPQIEEIHMYGEPIRYKINAIGFGQHGFAVFSNNGKIIKVTDDFTEIDYLFFWNYLTCSSEDILMVPIHMFFKDNYDDNLNILWKDFALAINEDNLTKKMETEFYENWLIRAKFVKSNDFGLDKNVSKNLGIYDGRVVFFDSGYHTYRAEPDDYVNIYRLIKEFEGRIVDVRELKRAAKSICKNRRRIEWSL